MSAFLKTGGGEEVTVSQSMPRRFAEGYVGIAARGLSDFEVREIQLSPGSVKPLEAETPDCLVCYPLGDSLKQVEG
ncbi:MAG: hypothetical protein AAF492_20735, partial [Verrucomicrobiota bacterium]